MSDPVAPPARAPEDDLEDIFEAAPCGYAILSPSGRILRVNSTLARWVGRPTSELHGLAFTSLLTTPCRIFYETNFTPALRLHGGFEEMALDLVGASGEKLPMLVNASERRNASGNLVAIRVTLFRAKDRRGYERDLHDRERRANERLTDEQETAQLREQFIAVLGHDLRNPLASIVGAARLLRREVQSEKALKVLQLMESSVDRMAGLIDDVMDFARGRLGRGISVERREILAAPMLEQVVAELATAHPGRTIEADISTPDEVSIDEARLGQMVSNLLANALTHGDPKAAVRLRARTHNAGLEVNVINRGLPISPAAMERLFQPFFRGEVRSSQQGLGLGLHIASEIAKAHGGSLSVSSDEAETCFSFTMPKPDVPRGS